MEHAQTLYEMIFRRKSFHLFRNIGSERISPAELEELRRFCDALTPLCPDIKTDIQIAPVEDTTCRRGQEYSILFYSEKKDNWLQNIGYLGEQLDLYLVSRSIGTLWSGIGKPTVPAPEGMDFVIIMAIAKVDDGTKFRKDMYKSKRKSLAEIWRGETIDGVSDIVRFAPSACNSQPWRVEREGDTLTVLRYKKPGRSGIMSSAAASYNNRIDMGIFLCFLELCLTHRGIGFERELLPDGGRETVDNPVAIYKLR